MVFCSQWYMIFVKNPPNSLKMYTGKLKIDPRWMGGGGRWKLWIAKNSTRYNYIYTTTRDKFVNIALQCCRTYHYAWINPVTVQVFSYTFTLLGSLWLNFNSFIHNLWGKYCTCIVATTSGLTPEIQSVLFHFLFPFTPLVMHSGYRMSQHCKVIIMFQMVEDRVMKVYYGLV